MLLTLFFGLITFVVLLIGAWFVYLRSYDKYFKSISGPNPLPLIGNALLFRNTFAILPAITNIFNTHGKISLVWLGFLPFVIISDYDVIEKVLSSTKLIEKSQLYKFLYKWLGYGLLTSDGPKWKKRRRLLTPTYHFQILEQFVPVFDKVGNNLIEEMKKVKNKDSFDVYPYVTLTTLDVICETAMGVPVNALQNKDSEYVESVKEMGRIVMERVFSAYQQIDLIYQFTENYRIEKRCLKILHDHTMKVIRQRRMELSKQTEDSSTEDDFGGKRRVAFLDLLLKTTDNGEPLSDEDIREEVDTFMFEGHDTTASGISFALFEIAKHPEVQQKILQEQIEIFGDEFREVTYQDLMNMKYLELVIKETLRLYPSVPLFAREAFEDTKIGDDLVLPKGSTIAVVPYQIHRDPKYFPDPEKFDPERFLPERSLGKSPYSFVPFSAGPRNCIGQKFAYLEMKSTISKIVRNFELSAVVPTHKLMLVSEAILKSDNGIIVKFQERV